MITVVLEAKNNIQSFHLAIFILGQQSALQPSPLSSAQLLKVRRNRASSCFAVVLQPKPAPNTRVLALVLPPSPEIPAEKAAEHLPFLTLSSRGTR